MLFYILLACFFFSGVTALIYELYWVRLLALTFGNTIYAIGIVLSAFMSGLSLGSFLLGKWADRGRNLLLGYAILEFGIAVSAMLSPLILSQISDYYLSLSITSMPLWYVSIARYLLTFAVLLIPTTFMGGTLPVLSKYLIRNESELENKLGTLYAINTFGGVIGTLLAGFFAIRLLGLTSTLHFTIVVNVCIGVIALYLGFKKYTEIPETDESTLPEEQRQQYYLYALMAIFLSGFAAMVYEISWSRLLIGVIGSSTYSFSIILIGFLSGIGVGSLLVSYLSKNKILNLFHFCAIEVLIGAVCVVSLYLYPFLPSVMHKFLQVSGESYVLVILISFLVVIVYLLVPTTLFGATFPIITAVYNRGYKHRGKSIGNIYAMNTVGAILGSSLAAFYFLPSLGTTNTIKLAVFINILTGIAGLLLLKRKKLAVISALVLVLSVIPMSVPKEALVTGVAIYGKKADYTLDYTAQELLYFREGLNATVAVTTNADSSLSLSTNGKVDGSTGTDDMHTQMALGYFPLLIHPNPEDILVVGVGTGVTLKAVLDFPTVRKVEAIEIEPAIIEAANFFNIVNKNALSDSRVDVIIEDARAHIISSTRTYDVIISEPSNPWINGIGNLFSRDFFQIAKDKLSRDGIFCQWVHLYHLRPGDVKMIINTFSSVFPEATIWQSSSADILIIGAKSSFDKLDYASIENRLTGKVAGGAKSYLNIFDAMDFLSYYVTGPKGVAILTTGAELNTDDTPTLEFNAPFSMYADTATDNNNMLHMLLDLPSATVQSRYADYRDEFLFRKILNYTKINIPRDGSWMSMIDPSKESLMINRMSALYSDSSKAYSIALDYSPVIDREDYEDMELLVLAIEREAWDGNLSKALEYMERAETIPENITKHSRAYRSIGLAFIRADDNEKGKKYLQKAVAINPFDINSIIGLTGAFMVLEMPDEACAQAIDAIRTFYNHRDQIIEKVGDKCGAI
jgi:spermidine synthase